MSKEYIIGGIDTDCGKTYVTGILAGNLLKKEKKLITSKLVQTGCKGISDDIIEHRRLMGIELLSEDNSGLTCPYVFSYPASPHLAAEIDNKTIDLNVIRDSAKQLLKNYDLVLSEAAGGLMVPITKKYLTVDYIVDNQLPLILVTSSKLGSINHTLLSLEMCKTYNIDLKLVIYNKLPGSDETIANSTFDFLKTYISERFSEVQLLHIDELTKNQTVRIKCFRN
ncbi:MAG: ATP-dependent dethiobiotin synthetase BioD [Chloroflexia bacterium]|nr:ATP-dependent dethiobiotin synthetase BioD [Chloroflexia bacterium]